MSKMRQVGPTRRPGYDARRGRLETYAKLVEMAFVEQRLSPLLNHAARLVCDLMDVDLVEILKQVPDNGWILLHGAGWRKGLVGDQILENGDSPMGLASNQPEVVLLTDQEKDTDRSDSAQVPDHWKHHHVRSSALVRIGDANQVWGVFCIHRRRPEAFHQEEIRLVKDLGSLFGLVVRRQQERDVLETSARLALEAKDEINALYCVSKTVLEGDSLKATIEAVTNESRSLVGASLALMAARNADGTGELWCVSPSQTNPQQARTILQAAEDLLGSRIIRQTPEWNNTLGPKERPSRRNILSNILVAPVTLEAQTRAILAFADKDGGFSSRDAAVASSFATLAALALDRHDAWQEARRQKEHLHHLADLALEALGPFDLAGLAARTLSTIRSEVESLWGLVLWKDTSEIVRAVASDPDWTHPGIPSAGSENHRHRSPAHWGNVKVDTDEPGIVLDPEGTALEQILKDGRARFFDRPRDPMCLLPGIYPKIQTLLFVPVQHSGRVLGAIVLADVVASRSQKAQESTERLVRPLALGIHAHQEEFRARKLENQLRRAQRLESVGRLAGGVAHDFNNLLTAIMSYTDMAMRQMGPQHAAYGDLREVLEASERAARLTRQLLAFSRRQILRPEVIDINAIIENMAGLFRKLLGEDIEILVQPGQQPGLIEADPGQIEQVLMNLVVNARDAMPNGGKLIIETDRILLDESYCEVHDEVKPGTYCLLAVTDTGIGMDAQTMAQIFDPFFTTKTSGQGTGLGLSTVYGIVKQSGGSLWCYSEQGRGTTFKIYLPAVAGSVDPAGTKKGDRQKDIAGHETLLVAEDEASVRQALAKILEEAGYQVLAATDGVHALALAEAHKGPIDLLVTDVIMPGMNGRELADRLTKTRKVEVIYISGYTDNAVSHAGILDQDVCFLAKPFSRRRLLETVRRTLDGRNEPDDPTNESG